MSRKNLPDRLKYFMQRTANRTQRQKMIPRDDAGMDNKDQNMKGFKCHA